MAESTHRQSSVPSSSSRLLVGFSLNLCDVGDVVEGVEAPPSRFRDDLLAHEEDGEDDERKVV